MVPRVIPQLLGLSNGGGDGGGGGGGGGVEGDRGRHRVPDSVLVLLRRRRRWQTAVAELEYRRDGWGEVGPSFIPRYLGGDHCNYFIFNCLQSYHRIGCCYTCLASSPRYTRFIFNFQSLLNRERDTADIYGNVYQMALASNQILLFRF